MQQLCVVSIHNRPSFGMCVFLHGENDMFHLLPPLFPPHLSLCLGTFVSHMSM